MTQVVKYRNFAHENKEVTFEALRNSRIGLRATPLKTNVKGQDN